MNFDEYCKEIKTNCENRLYCLKQFKTLTGCSYTSKKGKNIIEKSNKILNKEHIDENSKKFKTATYVKMLDSNFKEFNENLVNFGINNDTFTVNLSKFNDKIKQFFNSLEKEVKLKFDEDEVSYIIDGKLYNLENKDFIKFKMNNLSNFDYTTDIELLALISPYFEEWEELEKDYPQIRKLYYDMIETNLSKSYENNFKIS